MVKDSIFKELEDILGQGLETREIEVAEYAIDGLVPAAVAIPETVEQVAEVVRVASSNNLALVVRGGGTKIEMGNRPERLDLVLATSRINRITDMDTANLTVTAQAGVVFADLQDALSGQENRCYMPVSSSGPSDEQVCSDRQHMGCFVPLDPPFSDRATLGGIVAANSSGPRRLLYGTMRDMLLGVRYVNADGRIIGMGGKTVKNVSGYDVSKLLIGSMGSLGVICEMTLRLLPLPEHSATTIVGFKSLELAFSMVDKIMASNLIPAALEVLDARVGDKMGVVEAGTGRGYYVAVLAEGAREVVKRISLDVKQMCTGMGGEVTAYLEGEKNADFWKDYGNMAKPAATEAQGAVVARLSCPIARLKELMKQAVQRARQLNMEGQLLAHAGSGFGRMVLYGAGGGGGFEDRLLRWVEDMLEASTSVGGNMVIERAGNPLKSSLPMWGAQRGDFDILRKVKKAIDPKRIFSPGRFVAGI